MRLGEVLADEGSEEEAPRPRRRFGLWIALWLLLGLGALSWAHGPVVLFPEPDEAIVLYSPEGLGLLGPPVRTIVDKPFVVRLPLLQRFARIGTAERTVEVEARPTVAGVPIRLVGGKVRHRVRASDAHQVVPTLGVDPAVRDGLVRDLTRAAWTEAIGGLSLTALADPGQIAARLDAAGERLSDRAAELGIDATVEARPAVEVDPTVAGLLARIGEVEAQVAERAAGAGQSEARLRDDRLGLERRHRQARVEARAALQDRLAAAEAAAARARVEAERTHAARLAAARVERATLNALARTVEGDARSEADAVRTRVAALGQSGPRVLDHVIATHVMPQLERVRTGRPVGPALPVMPLPDRPPPPLTAAAEDADAPDAEAADQDDPTTETPETAADGDPDGGEPAPDATPEAPAEQEQP